MTQMVIYNKSINFHNDFIAMYAGKLKQNIPCGPGTFFRKNEQSAFEAEWMGQKSNGHTRWSFGEFIN